MSPGSNSTGSKEEDEAELKVAYPLYLVGEYESCWWRLLSVATTPTPPRLKLLWLKQFDVSETSVKENYPSWQPCEIRRTMGGYGKGPNSFHHMVHTIQQLHLYAHVLYSLLVFCALQSLFQC